MSITMICKVLKYGLITTGIACVAVAVVFGKDLVSYASSSARSVRAAIKGNVPIEFELHRARDLLDQIIPQLHANIRLIAEEEVELASLKADIE